MGKIEKIYIQDLIPGNFKTMLENFSCTDCGLAPHYDLNKKNNIGFKITFESQNWGLIDDQVKCPQCMRRIKIKKLIK